MFLSLLALLWHCSSVAAFAPLALAPREVRVPTCDCRRAGSRVARLGTRLRMGKGDGKRRRKKKASPAAVVPAAPAAPVPPRVSNDINIPVKRQIRWAKLNQEYARAGTSFRQTNVRKRTSYRKRLSEEEHESVMVDRRRRNGEVDWDVVLSRNGTSAGPLVLVDGYNVIYQWPRLKKHMLKGRQHRARDLLVRDLEELRGIKGWRIECVFDGFGRKTGHFDGPRGARVSAADRESQIHDAGRGVRVVYSGVGASADTYIEARCNEAKQITQGKLAVAGGSLIAVSNDSMIRMAATGAGALCMSSGRLVDELRAVRKITAYRVEAATTIVNRGSVQPEETHEGELERTHENHIPIPKMHGVAAVREVDGKLLVTTLRGGQFVIENKRWRKERRKKMAAARTPDEAVSADAAPPPHDVPSWAIVPDADKFEDSG